MRLKAWIDRDGRKLEDLAPLAGVNASNLSKIARGLIWVSGETADKIRQLTDGQVTPSDLLDEWNGAESDRTEAAEKRRAAANAKEHGASA